MNRYNILNQVISGVALVVSLVVLINQNEIQKRIGILDRAVRNLPGDVKQAVAEIIPKPKPDVPMADDDFSEITGTWYNDFITDRDRPFVIITATGVAAFGRDRDAMWAVGDLERYGETQWKIDARKFIDQKHVDEMREIGKVPFIWLKLVDKNTLQFKLDSSHGTKQFFAENGEKFVRWTKEKEKERAKGK